MSTKKLIIVNIDSKNYKDRCLDIKKQLQQMNIDTSNFLFLPNDVKFNQVEVQYNDNSNEKIV